MLIIPDRQRRFEQLRAHWKAAELGEQQAEMVGGGKKQTPPHVVCDEAQHNSSSSFRRKLSNGLAFISLTQRKDAHARRLSSNASLAMSAPSTNDSSTAVLGHDALLSPHADFTSATASSELSAPLLDGAYTSEDLQVSRQLPRSRTFSHIPRPVRVDGETQPAAEMDQAIKTPRGISFTYPKSLPPTRIPTPGPPQSKRRSPSPRQYLPPNPPLQVRATINRQSIHEDSTCSSTHAVVRSRTTPNLVKAKDKPYSAKCTASRRPGLRLGLKEPVLAENIPTNKPVAQRRSQIQDRPVKRESMTMPSATLSNRRSFGVDTALVQNKRASLATSISTKRLSSRLAPQSAPAACAPTELRGGAHRTDPSHPAEEVSSAQPQFITLDGSPTLFPPTPNLVDVSLALPSRPDTDNDNQRRTLGTPHGLGGVWRSSKVFAAANHQVRRFPRSSTFHHFGKRSEVHPPVTPTPNQTKPPSSSDVTQYAPQRSSSTLLSKWHLLPMISGKSRSSGQYLLSEVATARRSAEAPPSKFHSAFTSVHAPKVAADLDMTLHVERAQEIRHACQQTSTFIQEVHAVTFETAISPESSTILFPVPMKPQLQRTRRSASMPRPRRPAEELQVERHWSISERFYPDSADDATHKQVKDYMPPVYWAGRFQSLFDQWRTEAMMIMLNVKPETEGPLKLCGPDDENKATILIFMQLRDLCASAQAADSLHEFEYRHRRDRKLLDVKLDLPPLLCKPEDSTPKGPIGRAVRKLTPRKPSFSNLFKGRGWNRTDDMTTGDMPKHVYELQEITGLSVSLEIAASDSYESSPQLHAL